VTHQRSATRLGAGERLEVAVKADPACRGERLAAGARRDIALLLATER
jgi:hypothetical protein